MENFSREEVDNIIHMGERLAAKAVLTLLTDQLPQFKDELESEIPLHSGFVQIELAGYEQKLNVSLVAAPRAFVPEISVPAESAEELFTNYNLIKKIAAAFWQQFLEDHADLRSRLPDEFAELRIDAACPTSMYFTEDFGTRVSLFCYYVDKYGRPLVKK